MKGGKAAAAAGGTGYLAALVNDVLNGDFSGAWVAFRPEAVALAVAALTIGLATLRHIWHTRIDRDGDGILDAFEPEATIDGDDVRRRDSKAEWRP